MLNIVSMSLAAGIYRHIAFPAGTMVAEMIAYGLEAFKFEQEITLMELPDFGKDAVPGVGDKFDVLINGAYKFRFKVMREEEGSDGPRVVKQVGTLAFGRPMNCRLTKAQCKKLLADNGISMDAFKLVYRYCSAYANLYGVITVKDGYRIFDLHHPRLLTREQFSAAARYISYDDYSLVFYWNDYIICIDNDLEETLRVQQGKDLFIPTEETLMTFVEYPSLEGTEYEKRMLQFLSHDLKMREPEEALQNMVASIREGCRMEEIVDELEDAGGRLKNNRQIDAFLQLYQELNNNTRSPFNRGHTPLEIASSGKFKRPRTISYGPGFQKAFAEGQLNEQEVSEHIRQLGIQVEPAPNPPVGRNDPCPCGSGKKYKKCCGKLN